MASYGGFQFTGVPTVIIHFQSALSLNHPAGNPYDLGKLHICTPWPPWCQALETLCAFLTTLGSTFDKKQWSGYGRWQEVFRKAGGPFGKAKRTAF